MTRDPQAGDTIAPSLGVEDRYALACAPIDLEEHHFRDVFSTWLERLNAGKDVTFPARLEGGGLEELEEMLKLISVYRWLALKFPAAFTDVPRVELLRRQATEQTQAILRRNWARQGLSRRECTRCGRALLPSSPHRVCRECDA